MQVISDLFTARLTDPTVLTIGTFDGIHRGHQDLIAQLKATATSKQAQSAVIAFHPRPKTVFAPHLFSNDYLTTPREKIALLASLGIDVLILIPFSRELSQITAHDFVKLIVENLGVVELCVGYDFALGKNREGNVEKLRVLGQQFGYEVTTVEPFLLDGQVVSSTQVREQLLNGDVRRATYLLGRYPSLTSEIAQGAQRGRSIGFPTANFSVPAERLLPANGVYATFIQRPDNPHRYPSVTNIGVRPSFGGSDRTVEAHIFDFNEDVYGQTLTLEFVERLRPEQKFDGIAALVAQIAKDAEQARSLLAKEVLSMV
ncbi:MAG: bifunctional riboflavin kinase/FAD synthetase [Anaerolineaceae bacterium]|nr:bifunctional riboflavin kinase/FAD synthetase [Anaerolineaceae bacterium]MCB9098462.1 bifunctional riboflavin kinase/FAD synthetase [Anaerolineales bacterium]